MKNTKNYLKFISNYKFMLFKILYYQLYEIAYSKLCDLLLSYQFNKIPSFLND